jgi:hypothetical protein
MTTQQQQPETVESTERTGAVEATQPTGTADTAQEAGTAETLESAQPTGTTEPAQAVGSPAQIAGSSAAGNGSSDDDSLFASDELSGLRSRWDDVQSGFVDDPRDCVQKADSLVSDLVDRLSDGFSEARSRLEEQWARGEEASTEDLRLALKRYRAFFERLLAV